MHARRLIGLGSFTFLVAFGSVGLLAGSASAGNPVTLYVSSAGSQTLGCTDPGPEACATIQEGITAAEAYTGSDVTVMVAAGTYVENDYFDVLSSDTVTLEGAGASTTTIDGDLAGAVITLAGPAVGAVTIDGFTITRGSGDYGGGVANAGTVTLNDDTISNNSAYSSTDGGGVFNEGTATLADDTISNNFGEDGGGVYTEFGSATLSNDTFFSNSASYAGGGVYNYLGTATLTDDTFSNDSAGAGGGDGVYAGGTTSLFNSILDEAASCHGVVIDGGYNVESDNSCGFGSTDLVSNASINLAASLAANGSSGPETLAIGSDSSAFEEVLSAECTLTTDERGDSRPGATAECDAGAFEYQAPPTISRVRPSFGPSRTGGITVTVAGTNLADATAVDFGPTPASITADTSTSITVTAPAESAGTVDITVTTPDGTSATSSSDRFTYELAADTVTLTASANPIVVGQSVTYTAAVSPVPDGGTVSFSGGSGVLPGCGAVTVNTSSGAATCAKTYSSPGSDAITDTYSGDTDFFGSTSSSLTEIIDTGPSSPAPPPPPATTATGLSASANPAVFGQSVTFTATVTGSSPTGNVTFEDEAGPLGSATLDSSGSATVTTSTVGVGSHTITALYGGDGSNPSSTSTLTEAVLEASTITSLTASPDTAVTGEKVTYTAAVAWTSPSSGPLQGGTVDFSGVPASAGCTAVPVVAATGIATCVVLRATSGSDLIKATYSGNSGYLGSTTTLSETVLAASTTTSLTASPHTPVTGEKVTYTATVAATSPSTGLDGGKVAFSNAAGALSGCGAVPVVTATGIATCVVLRPTSGSDLIKATYSGSSGYLGSTATLSETVLSASTTTSLTASPHPAVTGEKVTYTATVAATSPSTGPLDGGKVAFSDTAGVLGGCGAVAVDTTTGIATCAGTYSSSGSDLVKASYSGGSGYLGSNTTLSETIEGIPTTAPVIAIRVTSTSAVLSSTLDPKGRATRYFLDYGATTAYGRTTSSTNAGSGTTAVPVSVSLTGLSPATTYHVRLVVTTAAGTAKSTDVSVTTLGPCASTNPNVAFVCSAYEALRGDAAGPSTLSYYAGLLASGTSRTAVATDLIASSSYRTNLVSSYYEAYLGRPAAPADIASYVQQLAAGATDETLQATLAGSNEFFTSAGGTNAAFVSALYEHLLKRAPSTSEHTSWVAALANGTSRTTVAAEILASTEYRTDLVSSYYRAYLGHAADPAGIAFYLPQLAAGATDEDVVAGIVGSNDFFNLHS